MNGGMFHHTPYNTGVVKPKPPMMGGMAAPRARTPWQQPHPQGSPMGGGTAPMQAPPGMGRVPQMQSQGPVQIQRPRQPRPMGGQQNVYKAALMEMGRNRAVAGRIR